MEKFLSNLSQVHHVNGALNRIEPTPAFAPLPPGQTLDIEFVCGEAQAARFYIMPNWYWQLDDIAIGLIYVLSYNYYHCVILWHSVS